MSDLVDPIPKTGGRSPQRQRRLDFERDYAAAQEIVTARSRGWCEYPNCDRPAVLFHHKAGRRVPDANHPDRLMHLCLEDHLHIHANPIESYAAGHMERRT